MLQKLGHFNEQSSSEKSSTNWSLEPLADLVKEFTQSIGQQPLLKQYETAFNEFVSVSSSRHSLLDSFEAVFSRLAQIYRWFPTTAAVDDTTPLPLLKSKHVQLLDWLRWLKSETSNNGGLSIKLVQSIYEAYSQAYNRSSFRLNSLSGGNTKTTGTSGSGEFSAESRLVVVKPEIEAIDVQIGELNARRAKLMTTGHYDDLKLNYLQMQAQLMLFIEEKSTVESKF